MVTGHASTEGRQPVGPVIVAIDGSELASRAIPVAAAVAQVRRVPLLVVRAVPRAFAGELFGLGTGDHDAIRNATNAELVRAVESIRAVHPDMDVRQVLVDGSPSREILRVQEESAASLVVLTSHGRTALARSFRGSVTEDVVRGAPGPVLVLWPWALPDAGPVRAASPAFTASTVPGRHVLVPLDGSARTAHAIGEAFRFARAAGGTIRLATVLDTSHVAPHAAKVLEQAVHRALADRAEIIERAGVACTVEVVHGTEPAEAIVGLATRDGCDVIAMTTHARNIVGRFLLGSVASRVAAQAARPVVLVPPHAVGGRPEDPDLPTEVRDLIHAVPTPG